MSKLYTKNGTLGGEEFSERIPIRQWIKNIMNEENLSHSIYPFLLKEGRYFRKMLSDYPAGIVTPYRVERRYCHQNNLLYGVVLVESQPEILADFQFVSGFYGVKGTDPSLPVHSRYAIHTHSFMTYKGAVLDCTVWKYPILKGQVDQYFGVSFDLQTVVMAYDKFIDIHNDISLFFPLQFLVNKPYLK